VEIIKSTGPQRAVEVRNGWEAAPDPCWALVSRWTPKPTFGELTDLAPAAWNGIPLRYVYRDPIKEAPVGNFRQEAT
jgi:hypothetical protein